MSVQADVMTSSASKDDTVEEEAQEVKPASYQQPLKGCDEVKCVDGSDLTQLDGNRARPQR